MDFYKNPLIKIALIIFIIGASYLTYVFISLNNEIADLRSSYQKEIEEGIKARKKAIVLMMRKESLHLSKVKELNLKIDSVKNKILIQNKKIKNYEEINFYDDIDSKLADSIITNSIYRHQRQSIDNLIKGKEN